MIENKEPTFCPLEQNVYRNSLLFVYYTFKIINNTSIRLFNDVLQGVGRNPKDASRKKGGIKVHALIDAFCGIVEFSRIKAAKEHDKKFMAHLKHAPNSFIVFNKAYNHYRQFL